MNIEDQRTIFAIRNRMINIPSNFVSKEKNDIKCICENIEEMKHVYECQYLNETNLIYNMKQYSMDQYMNKRKY